MNIRDRRDKVMEALKINKRVFADELAKDLDVSPVTEKLASFD